MHDAAEVIYLPKWVDLAWLHLQEVILLSYSFTDNQWTECKEKHLEGQWAHTFSHFSFQHSNSTWLDVVSDDAYMLVTVWTCVFVPETDHVAEFMHHNAKLITVLSYRDGLRAATSPPHVGATPAGGRHCLAPHPGALTELTLILCCMWLLKDHTTMCLQVQTPTFCRMQV